MGGRELGGGKGCVPADNSIQLWRVRIVWSFVVNMLSFRYLGSGRKVFVILGTVFLISCVFLQAFLGDGGSYNLGRGRIFGVCKLDGRMDGERGI